MWFGMSYVVVVHLNCTTASAQEQPKKYPKWVAQKDQLLVLRLDKPTETKTTNRHTVIVTDENGIAMSGIDVTFSYDSVREVDKVKTDSEGLAISPRVSPQLALIETNQVSAQVLLLGPLLSGTKHLIVTVHNKPIDSRSEVKSDSKTEKVQKLDANEIFNVRISEVDSKAVGNQRTVLLLDELGKPVAESEVMYWQKSVKKPVRIKTDKSGRAVYDGNHPVEKVGVSVTGYEIRCWVKMSDQASTLTFTGKKK